MKTSYKADFQIKMTLVESDFHSLTFGQKVRHKMIHDQRQLLTDFADKVAVKDRVAEQIGIQYVVPTIHVVQESSDLEFDKYPREFALKPSHGSQAGILVHESAPRLTVPLVPVEEIWKTYFEIHPDDLKDSESFITTMADRWLKSKYRPESEFCYAAIPPKIIIEKYLRAESADVLSDFRFYTFHGEVKFFRTAAGVSDDLPTYAFDKNGELLPVKAIHDNIDYKNFPLPVLPSEWLKMMSMAETLSMKIDFARIDFYLIGQDIFFSEVTNYPLAGTLAFLPQSFDAEVSQFWKYFDCCS